MSLSFINPKLCERLLLTTHLGLLTPILGPGNKIGRNFVWCVRGGNAGPDVY